LFVWFAFVDAELVAISLGMSAFHDLTNRGQVGALVKLGWSASCIAKQLNMNVNTIKTWQKQCKKDEKSFLLGRKYSRKGNPKFTAREEKRYMTDFAQMQPCGSEAAAEEIAKKPGATAVSGRTLRRKARALRWHPYLRPPKPDLSAAHKRERFSFAKENKNTEFAVWSFNDQFRVTFPLRSRRTPFWSLTRNKVKPQPTKKFPKAFNVHAAITRYGAVPLEKFDAPMNTEKFTKLTDEKVLPALINKFGGHQFKFQHDRAPWFTSREARRFFAEDTPASVEVVSPEQFPPNSPDFNLAENAMAIALSRVRARRPAPKTIDETFDALQEEWCGLSEADCRAMWDSMTERLRQCRAKKGGHTDY
jgi:hypothetical protein